MKAMRLDRSLRPLSNLYGPPPGVFIIGMAYSRSLRSALNWLHLQVEAGNLRYHFRAV
jgi:hypothetical protein